MNETLIALIIVSAALVAVAVYAVCGRIRK